VGRTVPSSRPDALASLLADLARQLATKPSVQATLQQIVDLAHGVVDGADHAGVTMVSDQGRKMETPACTSDQVADCDQRQYDCGQGPCLQAIGSDDGVLDVPDLVLDERWPHFAEYAVERGVRSMLAVQLATPRGTLGALNLYALKPHAFDDDSRQVAVLYASHASLALAAAKAESELRAAIESRQLIGSATGILMQRHDLGAEQAFQLLSQASQRSNVKVRELARRIVASLGDTTG